MPDTLERIRRLALWQGPVTPEPLAGGITNQNFLVADGARRYVVRVGGDIPVHGVLRFNELAASRAAAAAGVSPAVVHAEPGILVLDFVEGRTCAPADLHHAERLDAVAALLRRLHRELPRHLRGPTLAFWVFHVIRDYVRRLREEGSPHAERLARLLEIAERLEAAVGPIEPVFAHNDLLPANLIDDGRRLWLVDWDYAGWNSPLFDLANLASNGALDAALEERLLAAYFERPPSDALRRGFTAMKCASLLRESLWSMVAETHSAIDFDYRAYTAENLARFEAALAAARERDLP